MLPGACLIHKELRTTDYELPTMWSTMLCRTGIAQHGQAAPVYLEWRPVSILRGHWDGGLLVLALFSQHVKR
jgi:hypothetical protein